VSFGFKPTADALRSYFYDSYVLLHPANTISLDNDESFEPPIDSNGDAITWVRISIHPASAAMISLRQAGSSGLHQYEGVFTVEIFTPLGSGDGLANQYADEASEILLLGYQSISVPISHLTLTRVGGLDETYFKYNLTARFTSLLRVS
jgi:hypothetical protein